jgi:hypothetical protein
MATKMSPKCMMKESAHKCARRNAKERQEVSGRYYRPVRDETFLSADGIRL